MERQLKRLYYHPEEPSAYASKEKLFKAAKRQGLQISRKGIDEWLGKQETYTLHAPVVRNKVHRNRIIVPGPYHLWEADLMTIEPKYAKQYKFILVVVDAFTKQGQAEPLKSKRPSEVLKAFDIIIARYGSRAPKLLRTDQGKEFTSSQSKKYWKLHNIKHYTAIAPKKACFAERLIQTLGQKIEKFLTSNPSNTERNFLPHLPAFIDAYNNTVHSAHGLKPNEVNFDNAGAVYDKLYQGKGRYKENTDADRRPLKEGDLVRLSRDKRPFEKGRKANYTREIFKVAKKSDHPNNYHLVDDKGHEIKGVVYRKEVQKVTGEPSLYMVEVLQKKGNRALVHWIDYPDTFNQWIPVKDLAPLQEMDRR